MKKGISFLICWEAFIIFYAKKSNKIIKNDYIKFISARQTPFGNGNLNFKFNLPRAVSIKV